MSMHAFSNSPSFETQPYLEAIFFHTLEEPDVTRVTLDSDESASSGLRVYSQSSTVRQSEGNGLHAATVRLTCKAVEGAFKFQD